jgi:hypothetical protein
MCSENSFDSFSGGLTLRNKSVEEIRRELEPKVGSYGVKDVSLNDLLPAASDSSGEEDMKGGPVEDILQDLEEDNAKAAAAPNEGEKEPETGQQEKISVELTRAERDKLLSETDPMLKQWLKNVDITLVSEEEEMREECRALLKKQRKVIQSEVMQSVLGERFVEPENPEEEYPFEIEKLSPKRLRKLFNTLKEVDILGRPSTAIERQLMVEMYNPTEKTKLEQLREEYLAKCTRTSYDYCVTEDDFEAVYRTRLAHTPYSSYVAIHCDT